MSEEQNKGRARFIPTLTEVIDDAGDRPTTRPTTSSNLPPKDAPSSVRIAANQFARSSVYAPATSPTPATEEEFSSVMDMGFDPSMLDVDEWEDGDYGVGTATVDDGIALEDDLSIISKSKSSATEGVKMQSAEPHMQPSAQTQVVSAPRREAPPQAPIQSVPPVHATFPMQDDDDSLEVSDDGDMEVSMEEYALDESLLDLSVEDEGLNVEIDDGEGLDVTMGGMGAADDEVEIYDEIEFNPPAEMGAIEPVDEEIEVDEPMAELADEPMEEPVDEDEGIDEPISEVVIEEEIFSPLSRNPAASEDSIRPSDLMLLALTERISARVRSGVKKNLETHIQTKIFPLLDGFAENLVKHLEGDIIKMIREEMAAATREELDRLRRK